MLIDLQSGGSHAHAPRLNPVGGGNALPLIDAHSLGAIASDIYLDDLVSATHIPLDDRTLFLRRVAWLLLEKVLGDPTRESPIDEAVAVTRAMARLLIEQPSAGNSYRRTLAGGEDLATHSVNVAMLSLGLAHSMGVATEMELRHIGLASLLHDIGWSRNEEGWKRCDPAADAHYGARGAQLLEHLRLPPAVIDAVRDHHDRSGDMESGRQLSQSAAIIGIADVFEELRLAHGTRIGPHHRLEIISTVYADRFNDELFEGFTRLLATA